MIMNRFKGILLASDFDGTLTGHDGKIPQRNIDAIKYFISEGGHFTVSTGRTKVGFHNYSSNIINAPVLLGNGAMAYDYEKQIIAFGNCILSDSIDVINKILSENSEHGTEFYSLDGNVFVHNANPQNKHHFEGLKIASYSEIENVTHEMFPFVKIMVSAGNKSLEFQKYLDSIDIGNIKYIPTKGSFVEILSNDAGKGKALMQLADYLGIDRNNAYCIGDGSNDRDMLETASLSFSPCDGDPDAVKSADVSVCGCDDGSVADAIEYIEKNVIRN